MNSRLVEQVNYLHKQGRTIKEIANALGYKISIIADIVIDSYVISKNKGI